MVASDQRRLSSDAPSPMQTNPAPVPQRAVEWEVGVEAVRLPVGQTVRLKNQEGRLVALGTVPQGLSDAGGPTHPVLRVVKVLVPHEEEPKRLE